MNKLCKVYMTKDFGIRFFLVVLNILAVLLETREWDALHYHNLFFTTHNFVPLDS